jgi:hypothetical protein
VPSALKPTPQARRFVVAVLYGAPMAKAARVLAALRRDGCGDGYEQALVEDAAGQALSRWDERVSHHEVVTQLE